MLGSIAVLIVRHDAGLHVALRIENSRASIVHTLGTVFFPFYRALQHLPHRDQRRSPGTSLSFVRVHRPGLAAFAGTGATAVAGVDVASTCVRSRCSTRCNILIAAGVAGVVRPACPFLVIGAAFGFTIAAMLVPLLSEFDVALGRTTANEE